MTSKCFWVNGPVIPDYSTLSVEQLLALWHEHRNSNVGIMAADEICKRVEATLLHTPFDPFVNCPYIKAGRG